MRWIILVFIVALLTVPMRADARLTMGTLSSANSGGGGVGPSCSNSADFSAACNSSIAAAILGGFL